MFSSAASNEDCHSNESNEMKSTSKAVLNSELKQKEEPHSSLGLSQANIIKLNLSLHQNDLNTIYLKEFDNCAVKTEEEELVEASLDEATSTEVQETYLPSTEPLQVKIETPNTFVEQFYKLDTIAPLQIISENENVKSTEVPYECVSFEANFQEVLPLIKKTKEIRKSAEFVCDTCFYRTCNKSVFNTHLRVHTGEKPFQCDSCSAKFARKSHLVLHNQRHTGEKLFQCDFCSTRCSQKSDLVKHIRLHTGEKPFQCDSCSSRYAQKGDLVRHVRTHDGDKPFQCDSCSARFSRKSNLFLHNRMHTGEKPFGCESCSARFAQKSDLAIHNRAHTGEKPYMCDACSARFARKGDLITHIRTHTGEKPFKCDTCSARFAHKSGILRHKRMHSSEMHRV